MLNKTGIGFGQEGFRQLNCPISDCFTTDNRSMLPAINEFDAIVFHLRTFSVEDMPNKRHPNQRWIFWSLESPQYNMQDIEPLNGLFNWTMTYRIDSDIVQPYGWTQPLGSFTIHPKTEQIARAMQVASKRKSTFKKTKLVAWMVSNCQSKSQREKYANALGKYVPVDIYGDCSPLRCDRDDMGRCYAMLEQEYKFYLSFENSFCDDYATEKLYSILQLEIVPIVLGGANYTSLVPPFSYIDARDFKTARDLADFLKRLDADDGLYRQYFWWKPHYRIRNHINDLKLSMCGLCSRLHSDTAVKVYQDMEKWWVRDSHCKIPRVDNVFRIPTWEQE